MTTENLKKKIMILAKENKELKRKYTNMREWGQSLIMGYIVEIIVILMIIYMF